MSDDPRSDKSVRPSTEALKASRTMDRTLVHDTNFGITGDRTIPCWRSSFRYASPLSELPRRASWQLHIEAMHYTPLRVLMNDILLIEEESRKKPSSYRKATHAKNKRVHTSIHTFSCFSIALPRRWGIPNNGYCIAGIAPIEVIVDSDDSLVARDRLAASCKSMQHTPLLTDEGHGSEPRRTSLHPTWLIFHVLRCIFSDCSLGMAIRTLVESGDGTAMPVFYIIDMHGELFHFPTLIGPRTAKGVVSGVAELEHFEQVRQGDDSTGDLDTVLRSSGQQSDCGRLESGTYPYGKPLNMFSTRNAMNCRWRFVMLSLRIGNFMRWQAFYTVMQGI
ncbi:hypothetical protein JB92DRAFT_2830299 [Gautieria morchelliformis]|nr:hypothetical protein JB92DRAFT_2830299 [Gautieria morchelliformis]